VTAPGDPARVGRHDEEHLRRFLAARERGAATEMRRWWDELVIDFFDRMDGFVAAAHKGRLGEDEHELAVQLSMTRFAVRLVETFDGVSMGQLVNASKTLARGICMDVQRSSMRARRGDGPSLDSSWDDAGAGAGWEIDEAERRLDDEERAADARAFIDWALPRLKEERRRVIELTFRGDELPEIAQELGITRDNAYQRRSRAMSDLKRLKERYDA
jgi:RNA polymerase sigma factor (sigma-70 family)